MNGGENSGGSAGRLPEEFQKKAIVFVVNVHAATVNMRLYPPSSSMVTETLEKARTLLDEMFQETDSLSVSAIENSLLINDTRLEDLEQQKAPVRSFLAWMGEHGLTHIEFRKGITEEELKDFFQLVGESIGNAELRDRLAAELIDRGVEHIALNLRVYVAVSSEEEAADVTAGLGGRKATPLDALKDELLIRYLMGKVNVGEVEDRQVVEVLSDPGKVGGLLTSFLAAEGPGEGILIKSKKAEDALNRLTTMVSDIQDEDLRGAFGSQIASIIAEMDPAQMTSVLSGSAPESLDIRQVRQDVIKMLSDAQLLEMVDSLIDEYDEMQKESGGLETQWTREKLRNLNEVLLEVRGGERGDVLAEKIDRKLDEAGIDTERDAHTGKRVLSAYALLGGPLEEAALSDLVEGIDDTVPRQIRQLYAMEEGDLATGMLIRLTDNLGNDSEKVRRYSVSLISQAFDGLDEEHRPLAADVILDRFIDRVEPEDDYEAFTGIIDLLVLMARSVLTAGRAEDAARIMEALEGQTSPDSDKSSELVGHATKAVADLMGPGGIIDANALLAEHDEEKRQRTIDALAKLGPEALSPLVAMVKDRGEVGVRDRALEALKSAGPAGAQALLAELDKENPWYTYRNILSVLAGLSYAEAADKISEMVVHPDERIRREAVRSLARLGARERLPVVMNATDDPSPAVRRSAVRVLGMFSDRSVGEHLVDIINGQGPRGRDEDTGVMEAACLALGDLRDPSYVPQLVDVIGKSGIFKKGKPEEVRAAACLALANIGDPSAIPALEKARGGSSLMVSGSAEKALRKLRGGVTAPQPASMEEVMRAPAATETGVIPPRAQPPTPTQPPGTAPRQAPPRSGVPPTGQGPGPQQKEPYGDGGRGSAPPAPPAPGGWQ